MATNYHKCKICQIRIGTGCGCCGADFPEEYGYCSKCYPQFDIYQDKMQLLKTLLDRLDKSTAEILSNFLLEYEEDHDDLYQNEISQYIIGG